MKLLEPHISTLGLDPNLARDPSKHGQFVDAAWETALRNKSGEVREKRNDRNDLREQYDDVPFQDVERKKELGKALDKAESELRPLEEKSDRMEKAVEAIERILSDWRGQNSDAEWEIERSKRDKAN